jgi:hypothetical protein
MTQKFLVQTLGAWPASRGAKPSGRSKRNVETIACARFDGVGGLWVEETEVARLVSTAESAGLVVEGLWFPTGSGGP